MQQNDTDTSPDYLITMEGVMECCGYQNFDAMRQTWKAIHGKDKDFPGRKEFLPKPVAVEYLTRISRPYPNKPDRVIQGALKLLEAINTGQAITMNGSDTEVEKWTTSQIHVHQTKPRKEKPAQQEPPKKELTYQEEYNRARDEEDRQRRQKQETEEDRIKQAQEKIEQDLRPWVNGLTWALNYLEMLFLVIGFWVIAGGMGLVAGVFIMVLGSIILLMVRLSGSAAGWAVFAWLVVCGIGGWLVEYPAMLDAILGSGRIVSEDGETYAMISTEAYAALMTMLMSGSSFAGTCFRYLKSRG